MLVLELMSPVLSEATIMMINYPVFFVTLCNSWIKIYELDNTARVEDTKALLKNPTLCFSLDNSSELHNKKSLIWQQILDGCKISDNKKLFIGPQ